MLNRDQLQSFRDNGYLTVEGLIDPATLEAVKEEYRPLLDRLYRDWFRQGLVDTVPDGLSFWDRLIACSRSELDWFQHFDISLPHDGIRENTPMHFGPAVFDMVTHRNILDLVEQLIGPEITSNPIQHVRIKPPAAALPESETRAHIIATDWHQDMGVTLEEADRTRMVTVWLAITDATVENGCLQVAPGNRRELLPHCRRTQVGIADKFLSGLEGRPVPVGAGGAVVFDPFTPHASLPNVSDGFRWSFDLRYNITGQPTGRSQFPEFVARSRSRPESELRDWRVWRRSWRETRAHLANSPHIPQHRWRDDAPYCA